MYKIKKVAKILFIMITLILMNFFSLINSVTASNLDTANIQSVADCGQLLKYKGSIVITYYAEYNDNGVTYPAYCLDKTKTGVSASNPSYSVSVENAISDVKLWRILINGYPYKTIEELGVANREEAFTATKQAVYTYIHGNQLSDYQPIGEAGVRTLNALHKIVNDANNSTEMQISNRVDINRLQEHWEQDSIDLNYVSKKYNVSSNATINNYKVKVTDDKGQIIEDLRITDENNNEKQEFAPNETFKILVPIKSMKEDKNLKISIETKVQTKPILYGRASSSNLQDYALTAETYEDGIGETNDKYGKNETRILIVKQDSETKEKLEGVQFQLLDENKNVLYTNLQTDKNGMITIDNLLPGKYYVKETKTISGYELYEKLIEVEIALNEEFTVTVNNNKEDEPTIERTSDEKEVDYTSVSTPKILPITGM